MRTPQSSSSTVLLFPLLESDAEPDTAAIRIAEFLAEQVAIDIVRQERRYSTCHVHSLTS